MNSVNTVAYARPVRMMKHRSVRVSGRLSLVGVTLAYIAVFHLTYRYLVVPQQEFWGAGYRPLPLAVILAIYAACVAPAIWMPLRLSRPSLILFYVQYYVIFIPAAFLVFYSVKPQLSVGDALSLLGWMTAGIAVLQSGYLFRPVRLSLPRVKPSLFWTVIVGAGAALFAYIFLALVSNFRLVSIAQIYNVRSDLDTIIALSGSRLIGYGIMWLSGFFLPLAFSLGIVSRRRWLVAVALAGYVFFFGVAGQKSAILAIVYLPGLFFLVRNGLEGVAARFAAALTAVLLFGFVMIAVPGPLSVWYIAVVHFRILVIQGLNLVQYFVFFQTHVPTHFSHITGLNWFVRYPYDSQIPIQLGYYWYDVPVDNNSGFWAADAIAGFGPSAIPLVSAVAAGVFWIIDSCARPFDPRFAALVLSFATLSFGNASLATTFVSGGLGLICITLAFLPPQGRLTPKLVDDGKRDRST